MENPNGGLKGKEQIGFQWKGVSKKRSKLAVDQSSSFVVGQRDKNNRANDNYDSADEEFGNDGALKKRRQDQLVIPLIQPKHQQEVSQQNIAKTIPQSDIDKTKLSTNLSIEDRAAQEVLNDLKIPKSDYFHSSSTLIIPQPNSNIDSDNSLNGSTNNNISTTKKYQPILQASLAPELKGIVDENKRFKIDISLRPEEVSFKSNVYKQVPIEDFGAAMLRGMGWSGPTKDDEDTTKKLVEPLFARDVHLGLGAKAKPIQLNDKSKQQHNTVKVEKSKSEWLLKAEAKLATQKLEEGNIVWLRVAEYAGLRGSIVATRGVPGLNKISVALEESGREVYVKRTDVVVLSEEELKNKPFAHAEKPKEEIPLPPTAPVAVSTSTIVPVKAEIKSAVDTPSSSSTTSGDRVKTEPGVEVISSSSTTNSSSKPVYKDVKVKIEATATKHMIDDSQLNAVKKTIVTDRTSNNVCDETNGTNKKNSYLDKYASISSSSSSTSGSHKSKSASSSSSRCKDEVSQNDKSKYTASSSSSSLEKCWLQTGLYIKLISNKFSSKFYLKKGVILDVYGGKLASIRFDHTSEILENVKQKYIETVVPKKNEHCIVLVGKHRGLEAIVIERCIANNSSNNHNDGGDIDTVIVQLVDEMNTVIELSMDDVCAFQANLYHQ